MVEHNPPPSADNTRQLLLFQLRSMSPMNSFLNSMTEDSPAVDFRSVGSGLYQDSRTKVSEG